MANRVRGEKPTIAQLRRAGAIHSLYAYACLGLSHHLLEDKLREITGSEDGEVHERRGQEDHR